MTQEKFEIYDDVEVLAHRIKELDANGVPQKFITVFSKETLPTEFTREYDVETRIGEGSLFQKFESLFTKESSEERATEDLQLSEAEQQEFHDAIQADRIVAYIDFRDVLGDVNEFDEMAEDHIDLNKRSDY